MNCHICNKPESRDLHVRECLECEELTCEECAESDYDLQGDPPQFKCTQWDCKVCRDARRKTTEFEQISLQWVEKCKLALDTCPNEFVPMFTDVMFTGQRLITETRIRAEMNTAMRAT